MSNIATMIYRMMEKLDGEKGNIKLVPYSIAQRIKLMALKVIK